MPTFARTAAMVWAAFLAASALRAAPPEASANLVLVPSVATDERRLAFGEAHAYRARLDAGVWRLSVDQIGVDTVVTFTPPGGDEARSYNSPSGRRGRESFLVSVERRGEIAVSIRSRSRADGHYTVVLERLGSIDEADRSPAEERLITAETAATDGALHVAAGDKARARVHYRQALATWPADDDDGRARTLTALAVLARSLDAPDEAAELYRRALTLWRTRGDRENEAITLNRLGLTLDLLGDSNTAREHFERALHLWHALDQPSDAVPVRINLCLMLQRQGSFAEARDCYREARALVQRLGQPSRETTVLVNLAGVYWKLGEPDQALALYDEAAERSTATGSDGVQIRLLNARAALHADLGELEEALLGHRQALDVAQTVGHRRLEATTLGHLGAIHLRLGEVERAQTYLEHALPLLRAAGDLRGAAGVWRALGRTHGRQNQWPDALDAFGEALTQSRALEDRRSEATSLLLLGQAHGEMRDLERAVATLAHAVEIQRQLGDRKQEAQALRALGIAHHQARRPRRATALHERALTIFRSLGDRPEEAETLEALARVARDQGRIETALAVTSRAIEVVEAVRNRAGAWRQRASFVATTRNVYELHVDLLMQRHRDAPEAGHDRQAFGIAERARSQGLLDVLRADTRLDQEMLRRLRAAQRRLAAQTQRQIALLSRPHTADEATAVDRDVVAAIAAVETIQTEARRQHPSFDTLAYPPVVDVEDAASLLDPRTALVAYLLAEERSHAWVLHGRALSSVVLPPRPEIEAVARQAHRDLSTLDLRSGRTSGQALAQLSHLVLAPVLPHLGGMERLVIVADGALSYIPFAALPHPRDGRPLIENHEIVHLPSASVLATQRRQPERPPATKTLAVFADPVFDAKDIRLASPSVAPRFSPPPPAGPPRVRGALGDLGRLPFSGAEAEAIAALVDDPNQQLLALGGAARRERVVGGEVADYRYLHFATHGLINARHPELSGLALAQVDMHGRSQEGFLSMDDVAGLELNAEMVVLSGCQTALGKEIRGEGLVGLGRGFMAAGVPRVVASLWPVQDEATAQLMTHFYRAILSDGLPPAAALANAQRAIRAQRRWSDPYFWSAFVLLGDWR